MLLIIVVCLLKSMCIPSFVLIVYCVSELHGHLSSYHNYGLRLFYKNYIVYYNVVDYCGVFIEKYVYTKFRLDCLLCE